MTREDALRRTNEYPVGVRHGRIYFSTALISALVGLIASVTFSKFQADDHEKRLKHLEETAASADDVRYVRGRIDYAIDKIFELKEMIRK